MKEHAIVAHHDLDGVVSALLLWHWLGEGDAFFVAYPDLHSLLPRLVREYRRVWMVDLSPEGEEAWRAVRAFPGKVAMFDHHATACCDEAMALCEVDSSGQRCAAEVVADYLGRQGMSLPGPLKELVRYAHDRDLWLRRLPEADRFNDVVEELGAERVFALLREDLGRARAWTEEMQQAAQRARAKRERSLHLAQRTMVEEEGPQGWRLRAALCWGYVSDVAEALGGEKVAVLLWDVEDLARLQPSLHFRSQGQGWDLAQLAQRLGGGGHPQASGAPAGWEWLRDWMRASLHRLRPFLQGEPLPSLHPEERP